MSSTTTVRRPTAVVPCARSCAELVSGRASRSMMGKAENEEATRRWPLDPNPMLTRRHQRGILGLRRSPEDGDILSHSHPSRKPSRADPHEIYVAVSAGPVERQSKKPTRINSGLRVDRPIDPDPDASRRTGRWALQSSARVAGCMGSNRAHRGTPSTCTRSRTGLDAPIQPSGKGEGHQGERGRRLSVKLMTL